MVDSLGTLLIMNTLNILHKGPYASRALFMLREKKKVEPQYFSPFQAAYISKKQNECARTNSLKGHTLVKTAMNKRMHFIHKMRSLSRSLEAQHVHVLRMLLIL